MSSMQLDFEIWESLIWFLTTHATVLEVSNSDQTPTRYINISSHWRVCFCCGTRTPRLYWLLYSQCFAGNPAPKILKSQGVSNCIQLTLRRHENFPDTGDALRIHVPSKKTSDIEVLRNLPFCDKRGEAELYQLPPCQHCFLKHVLRAVCQTYT